MIKRLLLFICGLSLAINHFGAITVTSPSSGETVKAAEDFATAAFQDPWDMDKRTDLGWFIFDVLSGSRSNLTNISFSNGIFSASSTTTDPNISVLETGVVGTCFLGKIGTNYKINANKYKVIAIRMKLSQSHNALFYWSRNTIYNGMSRSGIFNVHNGWGIYIINIPSLGAYAVSGSKITWSGNIDSLRFDPASAKVDIRIDWIRLVENTSALYRTVKWTGNSGNVDIYLDNDKTEGNGTLGVVAKNVSGQSYSLYVGALSPGFKYYVGVKNSSGGSLKYSAGYYQVNDIPYLKFTSPSEEGGDDFAETVLKNAWDMNATSDLDGYANLSGAPVITNVSAENFEGDNLGSIPLLKGTNKSGSPDPILYFLWFNNGRGATHYIDSSKYRILVLKMGLPGNWDLVRGSVGRIYWHVQGEFSNGIELMHQSADVIIRHKSGKIVINKIITDMKELKLEQSQSNTGWNGLIDGFRIDPHEFSSSKSFYIQEVKLAAFERADDSYTFKWDYTNDLGESSTLKLYYDTNDSGFNGTLIKSGINPSSGKYTWNTSNKAKGTYYIYAVVSDGMNTNRTYARWPIIIDHSAEPTAEIQLSRSHLDFGAVGSTSTNPQTFLIENTGTGTMNWSVSSSANWLTCSPTSGSNSGVVTVSVNGSALTKGTYYGTVTVSSSNATNSPRTLSVTLVKYKAGTTTKPFGQFATPEHGSTVRSSIPVTGWVLDDIGLERVKIYNGSFYVGDAVFVEGARTDIEEAYPGYPQNYQAGWGYMLLTYFLPNGGNGTYTLFAKAVDKEGHQVTLGSKTITIDNAHAVKPFGAIDTPTQGGIASGSDFFNAGWVLTPQPNKIPENGSTIEVYVDSVKLGTANYGNYRGDIATLFPGYANSSAAGAYFNIDTTAYSNGIHSIYWIATDNAGNKDGIGSRFFVVQNIGTAGQSAGAREESRNAPVRLPDSDMASILSINSVDYTEPVGIIKGYRKNVEPETVYPDNSGLINIEIKELEHLETRLFPTSSSAQGMQWVGYHAVGSQLRPLPIGSFLDTERGVFYWSPGPGFVGNYELVFVENYTQAVRKINIKISPRYST